MKTFRLADRRLFFPLVIFALAGIVGFGVVYASTLSNNKYIFSPRSNCSGQCIYLYETKASPDTIAVKLGSYLQFNSADGKPHSLSLGKGGDEHNHRGKFNSGEFSSDEGWRVQFNEEGSFFFHDHLNPKINVLVVVYTPGKQYKIE